jgi:hypothetical protein
VISSRKGVRINPQKIARVTGVLFLITFITAIPPFVFLYVPVVDDPRYIVGAGFFHRLFSTDSWAAATLVRWLGSGERQAPPN